MNNLIFLDFDGVLFNTAKEAYAVSMIAVNTFMDIDNVKFDSKYYHDFIKYRYLVGPAWNYKYILEILDSDGVLNFEHKYKTLIQNAKKEDYQKFENSFFEARRSLKEDNFSQWLQLNEPNDFLTLVKPFLVSNRDFFRIITTKDKATVTKLLDINNVLFCTKLIYDREDFEKYENKANIIKSILSLNNVEKAIFIDDSEQHLSGCRNIKNLELCQPNWGYVSKDDKGVQSKEVILEKVRKLLR